jgi:hypothetical protein
MTARQHAPPLWQPRRRARTTRSESSITNRKIEIRELSCHKISSAMEPYAKAVASAWRNLCVSANRSHLPEGLHAMSSICCGVRSSNRFRTRGGYGPLAGVLLSRSRALIRVCEFPERGDRWRSLRCRICVSDSHGQRLGKAALHCSGYHWHSIRNSRSLLPYLLHLCQGGVWRAWIAVGVSDGARWWRGDGGGGGRRCVDRSGRE